MSQGDDFSGDLPPLDPDLAAWLASDEPDAMPADVWANLEARLASEPAFAPSAVPPASDSAEPPLSGPVDLAAARARRRRGRVLPILAGAAGVALVGAVVLPSLRSADPAPVADGVPTSQPLVAASAEPGVESGVDTPTVAAPQPSDASPASEPVATPSNPEGAAAVIAEPVMPRAMVSTGTDYTMDGLPAQVITLLADAGMSDGSAVATAMTASPSPTAMPGVGLASSPEALADCMKRLGLAPGSVPLVLDTATIDGREGSVIVTASQLDLAGQPASLHVVAVGQACTDDDVVAARHWDLPLR